MSSNIDVLTVGNAIVDIFARCDDAFRGNNVGKGMMNLVDAEQSAALYADIGSPREISVVRRQHRCRDRRAWWQRRICRPGA